MRSRIGIVGIILALIGVGSSGHLRQLHAQSQPSADEVMSDMGLSADVKQRVLSGEFVTTANFAVVVRPVPASGALVKINGFSAENGSTPGGAYS